MGVDSFMYSYGWCRKIDDAELLLEAGFDYIEGELTALKLEDDNEYKKILPRYLDSPLPVRAVNLLFPNDMMIVGPDVNEQRILRYVVKMADALNRIGVRVAVLGSGKSRTISEGWSRSKAEEQFLWLLNQVANELSGTGAVLAIEPLFRKGTNFINSVEEASRFAQLINREPIRVLADLFHMDEEQEPLRTLLDHSQWLAHIHVADSGRLSPGTGQYPYDEFADVLLKSGYEGMISTECKVIDNSEYSESLTFLKRKFD